MHELLQLVQMENTEQHKLLTDLNRISDLVTVDMENAEQAFDLWLSNKNTN